MQAEEAYLSLIVPVFNETGRLETSFPGVYEYVKRTFRRWEIIYVDDGSTDGTYEKLLELQTTYSGIRLLRLERNYGKGCAVRRGFAIADGEFLLFSDADFSTPVEETEKLLSYLLDGYDIAIGSRGLSDSNVEVPQSWTRETLGKVGNLLVQTFLPLQINDTQCGFKIFRRAVIRAILPNLTVNGFAFDMEILTAAVLNGFKIAEVPVTWRNVAGSKVQPIHSIYVLRDLFSIRLKAALNEYTRQ